MDLVGPSAGQAPTPTKAPTAPKPSTPKTDTPPRITQRANDLHAGPRASSVIDLRGPKLSPPPAPKPAATVVTHTNHNRLASPPDAAKHQRHGTGASDRFERALQFSRSSQISRFGANAQKSLTNPAAAASTLEPMPAPRLAPAPPAPAPELPRLAATQHAAMARLAASAPPPATTPTAPAINRPAPKPSFKLATNAGRYAATAAAVVIMGGYIWFHNYPKLTIQNASAKAGITATMPSYLPSSYTLASTHTKSGFVSLSFSSPSVAAPLTITQQSSSWDPSSLLDNYVAKNADDYDAVGGQGLTIYLFGENTATWVNHGIWYSIAGAQQLSREQVLKIAYSL